MAKRHNAMSIAPTSVVYKNQNCTVDRVRKDGRVSITGVGWVSIKSISAPDDLVELVDDYKSVASN